VDVDEDKLRTRSANSDNSSGNQNSSSLEEDAILGRNGFEGCTELVNSVCAVKLVRVGVLALITQSLHEVLPILGVLSWVELFFLICFPGTGLRLSLGLGSLLGILGSLLLGFFSQLLSRLNLAIDLYRGKILTS